MLDPKQVAAIEQALAAILELMPAYAKQYRVLYDELLDQKFNETQAMQLVKAYILSQNPHGIRGAD